MFFEGSQEQKVLSREWGCQLGILQEKMDHHLDLWLFRLPPEVQHIGPEFVRAMLSWQLMIQVPKTWAFMMLLHACSELSCIQKA